MFSFFKNILAVAFVFWSVSSAQAQKLSPFQKALADCQLQLGDLKKISTLKSLHKAIDSHYLLNLERTKEREVIFTDNEGQFKLKVLNDKLSLFQIDAEGKVSPRMFDAKQKLKSVKGLVQQILLNKRVQEDWGEYFEIRENGVQVDYSVREGNIKKLSVNLTKTKHLLECTQNPTSEICVCVK